MLNLANMKPSDESREQGSKVTENTGTSTTAPPKNEGTLAAETGATFDEFANFINNEKEVPPIPEKPKDFVNPVPSEDEDEDEDEDEENEEAKKKEAKKELNADDIKKSATWAADFCQWSIPNFASWVTKNPSSHYAAKPQEVLKIEKAFQDYFEAMQIFLTPWERLVYTIVNIYMAAILDTLWEGGMKLYKFIFVKKTTIFSPEDKKEDKKEEYTPHVEILKAEVLKAEVLEECKYCNRQFPKGELKHYTVLGIKYPFCNQSHFASYSNSVAPKKGNKP